MVATFYSQWTAGTWAAIVGAVVIVLGVPGGVIRLRRLLKPVVFRRARMPGHLMDNQFWPRAHVMDSGDWQLARVVFQVNNRSDSEQSVVFDWAPRARIWMRKRRGMNLCAGRMAIPAQSGGWVGLCVIVAEGHKFHDRDRILCRVSGRLGQSGKRISYLGFARLHQYPQLDGADYRGGNSAAAK